MITAIIFYYIFSIIVVVVSMNESMQRISKNYKLAYVIITWIILIIFAPIQFPINLGMIFSKINSLKNE